MAWDYERSCERIVAEADRLGSIEVSKLTRGMDLENLSPTNCREVFGAHVYVDVSNLEQLVSDGALARDDYKRLIRCVHLYQREVSRILEKHFEGVKVHFQGTRLHALFYRPIDNGLELAIRATLFAAVVEAFVELVFNRIFDQYEDFQVAAGIDIGNVIATKNGTRGDRELLFLGAPANHAAKIIGGDSIHLTANVYDCLPDTLANRCGKVTNKVYRISFGEEGLPELLDHAGIQWDAEVSEVRVRSDLAATPLHRIRVSGASSLIDPDELGITNNKRVSAASLFADVSGFTHYIDSAETTADQEQAIRLFHLIRKELREVVRTDYNGLRIQYQGDRIQALFHLPTENAERIAAVALNAALASQSSMEYSLSDCLDTADLSLAVGVAYGKTLISNLGIRGQRDRICIGVPVTEAARCEELVAGGHTGIADDFFSLISKETQELFRYDKALGLYVADRLTLSTLAAHERGQAYDRGLPVVLHRNEFGRQVHHDESQKAPKRIYPTRPWAE